MSSQFLGSAFRGYAFATLALAGLAACSADAPGGQMREKYATYPENIRKAIDNGVVLKGMTQEQVVLAIGRSQCVDGRSIGDKFYDSWSYHADKYTGKLSAPGRCPGEHPVIFEDGYVIEGQTQ